MVQQAEGLLNFIMIISGKGVKQQLAHHELLSCPRVELPLIDCGGFDQDFDRKTIRDS